MILYVEFVICIRACASNFCMILELIRAAVAEQLSKIMFKLLSANAATFVAVTSNEEILSDRSLHAARAFRIGACALHLHTAL